MSLCPRPQATGRSPEPPALPGAPLRAPQGQEDGAFGLDAPCMDCSRYRWPEPRTCAAFPEGIPTPIWAGDDRHLTAFEGDRGLRFDPSNAPS